MNTKALAATMIGAFLLFAGTATAGSASTLPDPDDKSIVVAQSIGGVEIGDNLQAANRAWGGVGRCHGGICAYGSFSSRTGAARIVREDGEVFAIQIHAGSLDDPNKDVFEGPLLKFKTTIGEIGLGSKLGDVRRAFPDAEPTPGVGRGFQVEGKGTQVMLFEGFTSDRRVVDITLRAKPER